MRKIYALAIVAFIISTTTSCAFLKNFQVGAPEGYSPFEINSLRSDEPLIIEGPFMDETIKEQAYIVTDGYVKLHKKLWKKAYPQSKDAEGITRSRLLIEYTGYPAKYKGDDVIFESAWRVRAELVEFVESERKK